MSGGSRWIVRLGVAFAALLASPLVLAHAQTTTTVEFDREIVHILDNHCVACHIQGGPAFALVTYEQTYRARWQIRQGVLNGHMPPWAGVHGYGEFANDNRLTQREIDFVSSWAESFGPRNNGTVDVGIARGPIAPRAVQAHIDFSVWAQGKPDLLLTLPAVSVAAGTSERIERRVIDAKGARERWLVGLEYKPGDRRVVHAASFTVQETGQWLGSWTPWRGYVDLPAGLAYRLPAGAHIAVEVHYYGAAQPVSDQGSVALYFGEKAPERVVTDVVLDAKPPAAASDAGKLVASTQVSRDLTVLGLQPALRAGVQSIEVTARHPDGSTQVLLFARDIPLSWPTPYLFSKPVPLGKGTQLSVIEHFGSAAAPTSVPVTFSTYAGQPLPLEPPKASAAPVVAAVQRFKLEGTVKSIDAADRHMVIAHGAIPGYMGAMTMSYAVGTGESLQRLHAGDHIRSDVVVNEDGDYLENIVVTRATK